MVGPVLRHATTLPQSADIRAHFPRQCWEDRPLTHSHAGLSPNHAQRYPQANVLHRGKQWAYQTEKCPPSGSEIELIRPWHSVTALLDYLP
jgi:hypothetical protein